MAKKLSKRKKDRLKRQKRIDAILEKYRGNIRWADKSKEQFQALLAELSTLNLKCLNQLHIHLHCNRGFMDPNKELREGIETLILERTILT